MADINIERKGGGAGSIIPWIIGLLVLALLAWWLLAGRDGGAEADEAVVVDSVSQVGAPAPMPPPDTTFGATGAGLDATDTSMGGMGTDTGSTLPPP